MPTKQYTDAHNFGLRDKLMRHKVYERLMFYPFVGDISVETRSNVGLLSAKDQITVPNDVVWRLQGEQFINEGTDYIHMPLALRLEQPEKYGSHYLVGTGEDLNHKYRKLFINQMSGTVTLKKSELDKIRTDKWEQYYNLAEPKLVDWFAERLNANFISCFYEGHNLGVTEGLNDSPDGIAVHMILHPNMWYKSADDTMTPVGTLSQNKTHEEVNTAVQSLGGTVPAAGDMYAIARTLTRNNIQKGVVVDGQPYWLAVINLETWHNLIQDATIRGDYRAVAGTTMYKNYLYAPTMYRWGDFVFLIDEIAARSWDSSVDDHATCPSGEDGSFAGQNGYHNLPTNNSATEELEDYPNTTINIYGRGSLGYADIMPMWTKPDVQNYEQQKELAAMAIFGLGRNDWIHKDIEATFYAGGNDDRANNASQAVLNQSSAIFIVRQS